MGDVAAESRLDMNDHQGHEERVAEDIVAAGVEDWKAVRVGGKVALLVAGVTKDVVRDASCGFAVEDVVEALISIEIADEPVGVHVD